MENMDLLRDMRLAMEQIEDPENAIALIEELIESTPPGGVKLALQSQLTMYLNRSRRTGNGQATLPMNDIPLAPTLGGIYRVAVVGNNRSKFAIAVDMKGVQSIKSLFDATGDIYYLNLAITMVQRMVATGSPENPNWSYQLSQLALYLSNRFDILDAPEDLELAIQMMHNAIAKIPFSDPRELDLLDTLSSLFHHRYLRFGELNDLEKAINATEGAIAAAPRDDDNRFSRSMNLGGLHRIKFQCLGISEDLDKTIQATKQATPATLQERMTQLNNLGLQFHDRFLRSGDLNDLDQSIQVMEEEIVVMAVDNPVRVSKLDNLAGRFKERFDISEELNDLMRSIQTIEEAIAVTPQDSHDRFNRLASLGGLLGIKFGHSENLEDINKAIQVTKEFTADTSPEHPERMSGLKNLSLQFYHRFLRSRDLDDLGQSIRVIEEIIAAMAEDDPARVDQLDTLASYLTRRFDECEDLNDLERSIQAIKEVIAITPRESHARPKRLIEFGHLLNRRFTSLVNLEDIDKAIEVSEQGALATPIGHPDRPQILLSLACNLLMRSQQLETLDDLTRSIQILEEAQHVAPLGHPCRGFIFDCLATGFHGRFKLFGDLKDLNRAVEASAEAVAVTLPDNPDLKIMMINHGISLRARFYRLGSPEDLDNAIQLTEDAVAALRASGGPGRALLLNLGHMLHTRFERFGALEDLDMAITVGQEAVESTPSGHITRPRVLDVLAANLCSRFGRSGAVSDLESAIEVAEESLAATPRDKPCRAGRLHNLSIYFYTRYCHSRALADLTRAIETSQEAMDGTRTDHIDRGRRLMTMSMLLAARYHRSEAVEDLESSIEVGEYALQALPIDDPWRAGLLDNQARYLEERTVQSTPWASDVKKVKQAIELQFPHDSEARYHTALRWENIGGAVLNNRAVHSESLPVPHILGVKDTKNSKRITKAIQSIPEGPVPDFTESINHFLMAWGCETAPPLNRIVSARHAAVHLGLIGRWAEASSLLEAAVKILPTVSPRFLSRDDQQLALSRVSELAALALSTSLQAGLDTTHCLTLLELGRGIIMGFGIDCRSDLSTYVNSKLFNEFSRLRIEVDSALLTVPGESGQSAERRRRRRLQAIDEMGQTLASIRQQPGYEEFQLPPHPDNLKAIAKEGAIIIINCTLNRSDAIMVTKSDIKLLRLPKLVLSEVGGRMKVLAALVRGSRATYTSRNEEMAHLLLWLWEAAVEPVFNELGLHAVKDGELPRVWWIGVGCLSAAPFHAAGDHSRRSTRNTLSRAISSYIPTIKALSFARQKKLNLGPNCRLLLVTMPTTPNTPATPFIPANTRPPTTRGTHGLPAMYRTDGILATPTVKWMPLKNAQTEVNDIFTVVNESSSPITTRFESPTVTQVLEELPYNHVIHFACHGVSDTTNPSNSHLLLHGDDPSTLGKLTVKAISNMNIKDAQVAYLSACCTADNPSAKLADESIHIASGFQLAGFSHVLGTLWDSNDEACRKVSGEFYRRLFHRDRSGDEGHRAVSTAFHHAVKKLRGEMRGQPIKWASFVHTGA